MERILSILLVASTTARKVVVLDDSDWDSVVVTSQPVKITNSRFNPKNNTHKENSIDFDHSRTARHINNCEEGDLKCLYDHQLDETSTQDPQDTVEKFLEKYSSVTNVKVNDEHRNTSSKAYWNQIESQKHNHPYDDAQGWVTLDPIPWSTSKVSKWKPENHGERPWAYGPPQHHQQPANSWVSNRPFAGERPASNWGVGPSDIITDNRPNEFPLENYPNRPDWGADVNPAVPAGYLPPERPHYIPVQHPNPPNQPAYPLYQPLTQSQYPVQSPQQSHYPPPSQPSVQSHYPSQPVHSPSINQQYPSNLQTQPSYNYDSNRPPYQWQDTKFHGTSHPSHNHIYSGNGHQPTGGFSNSEHPMSYPDGGRGEWVLVSTTKGYSVPQRYHDRKMHVKQILGTMPQPPSIEVTSRSGKSKYQENDIEDKFTTESTSAESQRKSDTIPELGEPIWNVDGINIHKKPQWNKQQKEDTAESSKSIPQMTLKRTVRLTVLPALNNTSTLSHGGMLEVDANRQTVDEAQREQERLKKLKDIAIVSTGRQPFSMVPLLPRNPPDNTSSRRAAVIAAVSAGMIPATMALLLPAALGRKRRSLDRNRKLELQG